MGHQRLGRPYAVLIAAIILWVQPTRAEDFISGNTLVRYCHEGDARQFTLGFVAGVHDTVSASPKGRICLPDGVRLQQLADVVCKYLTDHPESRHHTGSSLALIALQSSFPCSK
jgi:Rap1a immunity proteins